MSSEWLRAMPPFPLGRLRHNKDAFCRNPHGHHHTDCNTHGNGAGTVGCLTGENAVSLVVYDGLP